MAKHEFGIIAAFLILSSVMSAQQDGSNGVHGVGNIATPEGIGVGMQFQFRHFRVAVVGGVAPQTAIQGLTTALMYLTVPDRRLQLDVPLVLSVASSIEYRFREKMIGGIKFVQYWKRLEDFDLNSWRIDRQWLGMYLKREFHLSSHWRWYVMGGLMLPLQGAEQTADVLSFGVGWTFRFSPAE